MQNVKENIIVIKTFEFSLLIIRFSEELELRRKFVVGNQLLRCGTSVGANVREAQNAESRADFIHKMKIAAKEADECEYWLLLCSHSENYPDCDLLISHINEIIKIISKIIGTTKNSLATKNNLQTS